MTDEQFLRGCVGFFLYPVTWTLLIFGFVGCVGAASTLDVPLSLVSLTPLSIGIGILYVFPIPSLLGKIVDDEMDDGIEREYFDSQEDRVVDSRTD